MTDHPTQSLALPAVFDLDALDPVRDRLAEAIDVGPVELTGAAVERIATNALLMLLSAARTAEQNGFGLEIADPSPTLKRAVDRLGLEPAFAGILRG